MKSDTTPEPEKKPAEEVDSAGCAPTAGYASLLAVLAHHEQQGEVRVRHAAETRAEIAKLEADGIKLPDSSWERVKSYNLTQADFDEKWGKQHQEWAEAIRAVIPHNV